VLPLSEGNRGDSSQFKPCKVTTDNTAYARSLGPYVQLPFAKSLRGQNHSSTLETKSWFHSDRSARPSSWATSFSHQHPPYSSGYGFDQAVTKATRFTRPHKSCMRQYTTQTCSLGLDDRSLTDMGKGYHGGAQNIFLSTLTLPIR
jgi:hypothetical protein